MLHFCQTEWLNPQAAKGDLCPYWKVRAELTYCDHLPHRKLQARNTEITKPKLVDTVGRIDVVGIQLEEIVIALG